jgi:hypothetical protein
MVCIPTPITQKLLLLDHCPTSTSPPATFPNLQYFFFFFFFRFETSAKENINIDKAAKFLVQKILENDVSRNQEEVAPGKIEPKVDPQPPRGCCG